MKDEKYPIDEDERITKRLRRLMIDEGKFEETEKVEKKRIQKDKIIDEEEDEENEYTEGRDKEKDYEYEEDDERRRRI